MPLYVAVRQGIPLYERMASGEFELLSEDETVEEIGMFVEQLDCQSYLVSDQMSNLLWEVEGRLPMDKEKILNVIYSYQQMDPFKRLRFRLERRLSSFVSIYGGLNEEVNQVIESAYDSIKKKSADAEQKTNDAISALKYGFR